MEESVVEKREYTFLLKIIGAYLFILALNVASKMYLGDHAFMVSAYGTGLLGLVLIILYSISLKPKLNQLLLLIACLGITFWAIVAMTYDLPYKKVLAGVSIPLFLTLCGMWIYVKYSKVEVK